MVALGAGKNIFPPFIETLIEYYLKFMIVGSLKLLRFIFRDSFFNICYKPRQIQSKAKGEEDHCKQGVTVVIVRSSAEHSKQRLHSPYLAHCSSLISMCLVVMWLPSLSKNRTVMWLVESPLLLCSVELCIRFSARPLNSINGAYQTARVAPRA